MNDRERSEQIKLAANGNAGALRRLIEDHRDTLLQKVSGRLDNPTLLYLDSEYVVQAVYSSAFRDIRTRRFDEPAQFHSWIEALALNVAKDAPGKPTRRRHRSGVSGVYDIQDATADLDLDQSERVLRLLGIPRRRTPAGTGARRLVIQPGAERKLTCPIGGAARIVVTSDRQRIDLTPVARAPWARMGRDHYGLYAEFDLAGVRERMRWIGPGTFMMGSPEDEADRDDNELLHEVTLTRGFWLGETACRQSTWQAVMGGNPNRLKGEDRPVENVSWEDCERFLERANALVPDSGLRLPTEAEWEYACRAGTTTRFSFGDTITAKQVNCRFDERGRSARETVDVKALPCNPWGLYQMHGNVYEWCQDWFGDYPAGPVEDPTGAKETPSRVLRGGSWLVEPRFCRSACRRARPPGLRSDVLGFRLARGQ